VFLACYGSHNVFQFTSSSTSQLPNSRLISFSPCSYPTDVVANSLYVYVICHVNNVVNRIPIIRDVLTPGLLAPKAIDVAAAGCINPLGASLSQNDDVFVACWSTPNKIFKISDEEMVVTSFATAEGCSNPRAVSTYKNDVFAACHYDNNKLFRVHDSCGDLEGTVLSASTGQCVCRVDYYSATGLGPCTRCGVGLTTANIEGNNW
jgi:hypothetical protein